MRPRHCVLVDVALVALVALAAGCGSGSADPDPGAGPDGGAALCAEGDWPEGWTYPAGPYGIEVGDVFEPFTLSACDGQPVRFENVLAPAELALVTIGAGWCQPCIEESETIEHGINDAYCPRGLRIVQVLTEDEDNNPADPAFCSAWRDQYGLSFPVLMDPLFSTEHYFGGGQLPLNLLVDREGVIRYRVVGGAAVGLAENIESLLP